jgi:hypothetical protein
MYLLEKGDIAEISNGAGLITFLTLLIDLFHHHVLLLLVELI